MIAIYVKNMIGEIIILEFEPNVRKIDIMKKLNEVDAEAFPLYYTLIIRSDETVSFFDKEIVTAFVDMVTYYVEFPMVYGVPKSLETGMYQMIPNNTVKILEKDINDGHGLLTKFMFVEWRDLHQRIRRGYIQQYSL